MKTTELGRKDQFTEPDEHETSSAGVTGNPASSELLALVAQQPFFKGLSEDLIQMLADSTMEAQFKPGQWIFRQGDHANRFYLILEGNVLIESEAKERGMIPI